MPLKPTAVHLSQIRQSGAVDDDVPVYDAGAETWGPGPAPVTLAQIDASGASHGQVPVFDSGSGTWVPGSGGGGGLVIGEGESIKVDSSDPSAPIVSVARRSGMALSNNLDWLNAKAAKYNAMRAIGTL